MQHEEKTPAFVALCFTAIIMLWTANNMLTRQACFEAGGIWRVQYGCAVLGETHEQD